MRPADRSDHGSDEASTYPSAARGLEVEPSRSIEQTWRLLSKEVLDVLPGEWHLHVRHRLGIRIIKVGQRLQHVNTVVIGLGEFPLKQVEQGFQTLLPGDHVEIDEIPPGSPARDRTDFHGANVFRIGNRHFEKLPEWKQHRIVVAEKTDLDATDADMKGLAVSAGQGEFRQPLQLLQELLVIEGFLPEEVEIERTPMPQLQRKAGSASQIESIEKRTLLEGFQRLLNVRADDFV